MAGKSAGKAVVVGYAGWEAWAFAARGNKGQGARAATAEPVVAVSSSSSPEEDQPAGNAAAQRSSRDAARPPRRSSSGAPSRVGCDAVTATVWSQSHASVATQRSDSTPVPASSTEPQCGSSDPPPA